MKVIGTNKNGDEIAEVSVIELENMFEEIKSNAIEEFAKWCYVNGIDFSYMHKATDTEPFCKRVIDRFNEEQRKEGTE